MGGRCGIRGVRHLVSRSHIVRAWLTRCSYLIFAFQLCLWGNSARQKTQLGKKLTLPSLIGLRFMIPVFFYFFMVRTSYLPSCCC